MKSIIIINRCSKICICLILSVFLTGCIATTPVNHLQVAENYNTLGIQKVGVLVVRMGNEFPSATVPIRLETDFSSRNPMYGWHGAVSDKTLNVFIEDDNRLKEAFPFYPATTESPIRYLTDHYSFEFYRNFSKDIYKTLDIVFKEKGYEVVDIAESSIEWIKPVSESTISEILEQARSLVDSLAIFQYVDIGNSTSRVGAISSDRKGFIELNYSLFMFDTESKVEILHFQKDFYPAAVIALLKDPEIKDNPKYKGAVNRFEKSFGGWKTYYIVNELPDEILTKKLMSYIKDGFAASDENLGELHWTGLSSFIPKR